MEKELNDKINNMIMELNNIKKGIYTQSEEDTRRKFLIELLDEGKIKRGGWIHDYVGFNYMCGSDWCKCCQ
jgi:hypothetical protein